MTEIALQNIDKTFSGQVPVHALKDVNLTMRSGKITALLGPSGCGKTTTLKLIAGLLEPTSGDILFDNRSILAIPTEKRGAALVSQNHLLFPYMSVADNISFGLRMRHEDHKGIQKKVAEILEMVHLSGFEKRRPNELSGGQQQRVALARALVINPKVLLLDEPLSNLDTHLRDEMRSLIHSIQRAVNITTIFVTHDQDEAVTLADDLALMLNGQLQQAGSPRSFFEEPASLEVACFFGALPLFQGIVKNGSVQTELNSFSIDSLPGSFGPVQLAIRPEYIQLDSGFQTEKNSVEGVVESCIYMGTRARIRISIQQYIVDAYTELAEMDNYQEGKKVKVIFPSERLWAFPL